MLKARNLYLEAEKVKASHQSIKEDAIDRLYIDLLEKEKTHGGKSMIDKTEISVTMFLQEILSRLIIRFNKTLPSARQARYWISVEHAFSCGQMRVRPDYVIMKKTDTGTGTTEAKPVFVLEAKKIEQYPG